MIAAIAVVGIFSGIALMKLGSDAKNSSEEQRLVSQVASLNSAVQLYLSSGGSLADVNSPESVLAKLRTVASNGEKLAAFRGSFIDPRLSIVWQTPSEAAQPGRRVIWNLAAQRFVIVDDGVIGIKEFVINGADTPPSILAEERVLAWQFSATDSQGNWVWDYDRETVDLTAGAITTAVTGGESDDPDIVIESKSQLQPPLFNPGSGMYPEENYDLAVELVNPNADGSSILYFSENGGPFTVYTEPILVSPDTSVTAFSQPVDSNYYASFTRTGYYQQIGTRLLPPEFSLDSDDCCETQYPKTLTLTNLNQPASTMIYTVDGGVEMIYEGPIILPGNTEVSAYCRSDDVNYNDSEYVVRFFESVLEAPLAAPTISPESGQYEDLVIVTLEAGAEAPAGSRIFYTTDGNEILVDDNGEPVNGTLYSEAIVLEYQSLPAAPGDYTIDWDSTLWNDNQGWLDNQWNITQTLTNIGGSGVDLAVNLYGGPPAGDVPGPNLDVFSPLGADTHLRSTAGDLPDFYYSFNFSQDIKLDNFATGGLFTFYNEMLANRIDLYDAQGNQIVLGDAGYVTAYNNSRLDINEGGIETVGTTIMDDPIVDSERSTTHYDFSGLKVSEMRWWHYAYEVPGPATVNGTSEAEPGAETVQVGNDSVTFQGVLYDYPQEGESTWFYTVESGEQPEISHVLFDISDEQTVSGGVDGAGTWSGKFPKVSLTSGGGQPEIGYDKKTAAWGIKYDEGFEAYQTKRYYYTADKNYKRTAIPVFTKASNASDSAPITGPGLTVALDQVISSFTLVDADTNLAVPGYETLEDGTVLDLAYMPANFTISANTTPSVVGSVRFDLDGAVGFNVENYLPYALVGDTSGDYAPWNPTVGTHSVTAIPYSESDLGGTAGIPGMIRFSIINSAEKIGHDKSSFLSDIAFHIDGTYEVVARVFPPSGDPKCFLPSAVARKEFILVEGTATSN